MMNAMALLTLLGAFSTGDEVIREAVHYSGDDLQLAAELLLPESEDLLAGAVILQGSGDSDRTNSWAAAIAEKLAETGVAVLLTDKRGCGDSEGNWREVGFEELAQDALAGVAYLRELPELDPDRVGVVGLSQGGWVAPIAAARSRDVAFVMTVSSASVGYAEQVTFEMANSARQAGLSEAEVADVLSLNLKAGRFAMYGEWEDYAAARARALAVSANPVIKGFPNSADHPRWTFIRAVGAFDPMPYWLLVQQPSLIIYGAEDEKDNVPVTESVRRLQHAFSTTRKQNFKILVIPGAGHGLIDHQKGTLMAEFVRQLREWVRVQLQS
jgi:pimeloyl-ACP methyl ester carboxylesterase